MNIKKILLTLFVLLIIPTLEVKASESLTIDSKSYDETTQILKVSGSSNFDEVMVSIFKEDTLLSFKTVSTNNNKYNASFNITFNEDMEITIKIGDIESTDYEIDTLNVKKSVVPSKPNKLEDENGNSLTILDNLKKFELDDSLFIDVQVDLGSFNEEETKILELIQEKLGKKNKLVGLMFISVNTPHGEKELEEIKDGYKLFLSLEEDELKAFNKPYMARLLDLENFEFEEGKKLEYNKDEKGVVVKLNNVGIYILYDDLSVDYKFLDNTDNQTYTINKDDTLVLKIDAPFEKFVAVYVDGKLLDSKNYTAKSGSTIITFDNDYVSSLDKGTHNIKVDFTDGEANAVVTIEDVVNNPKTGDYIITYSLLGLISLVGIIYLLRKKLS